MCRISVTTPHWLYKGDDVVDGLLPIYCWLHILKCATMGRVPSFAVFNRESET